MAPQAPRVRDLWWRSSVCVSLFYLSSAVVLIFYGKILLQKYSTGRSPSAHLKDYRVDLKSRFVYNRGLVRSPPLPLNISFVEEHLDELHQRDPQLIEYTRVRHLTPPSKLPYNLKENNGDFKESFSSWVADFFKNKRNGTFIECGANEGEHGSHTLYLERELGWSGLLVECNPTVMPYLRSKHRKAWIADVCLSPSSHAATLNFSNPVNWTYSGTLGKAWDLPVPTKWTYFDVQAIPLYTILAALKWKEVDYFSFDIEGQELNVLKYFPFELFKFKVLFIEVMFFSEEEKKELDRLIRSKGYVFVKDFEIDKIYVHEDYKNMLEASPSITGWFGK